MKRPIALLATFGLALIAADAAFAQGYDCPFGRGNSYVPANIDRSAEYPESYGLSECRDGACPYAQNFAQQSQSYLSEPQRPWGSQLSSNRLPPSDWHDGRRSQTYERRTDERRPANYDLRDGYSYNAPYRQPSIYGSGSRYEQPRSYDRPQMYDRSLTSGPPATFDRSLTNSRASMNDGHNHQHDGSCNHDHGSVGSTTPTFDRRPLEQRRPTRLHTTTSAVQFATTATLKSAHFRRPPAAASAGLIDLLIHVVQPFDATVGQSTGNSKI